MSTVFLNWTDRTPEGFAGGAVTVGNFDGVHLGHRVLLESTCRWAKQVHGPALAVTFDPPPYQVLFPDSLPRPPLTALTERAELIQAIGINHVVVLRTTPELLALSPEAFFQEVLRRQLGAKAVVEGYNFRFGCNRVGNNNTLRSLCSAEEVRFEEVPPLMRGKEPISSSRVRMALTAGDVSSAADLLGRPFRIQGVVVEGAKRGRTIGFPTANLDQALTVLPGDGVYAAKSMIDGGQVWTAAVNVGPNPTFGEQARKVEVHLIGFSGEIYGQRLTVEFERKLRDTRPFASAVELAEQLKQDIEDAKRSVP